MRVISSEMNLRNVFNLIFCYTLGIHIKKLVTLLNWSGSIDERATSKGSTNSIALVVLLGLTARNFGISLIHTPFR